MLTVSVTPLIGHDQKALKPIGASDMSSSAHRTCLASAWLSSAWDARASADDCVHNATKSRGMLGGGGTACQWDPHA